MFGLLFVALGTMLPSTEIPEVIELEELVKEQERMLDAFKYGLAAVCVVLVLLTLVLATSIYTITKRENEVHQELEDLKNNGKI